MWLKLKWLKLRQNHWQWPDITLIRRLFQQKAKSDYGIEDPLRKQRYGLLTPFKETHKNTYYFNENYFKMKLTNTLIGTVPMKIYRCDDKLKYLRTTF